MDTLTAMRLANPKLSRFSPMSRIISFDDFDDGFCGYTQLVGNYEHTLDSMLAGYAQHTHPQLSNLANWDSGTHGAFDGNYALKIQTRPKRGAQNVALKRLTFREPGPIRLEFYFTFKPEANELRLSETDVRSIGFLYDLQTGFEKGGTRVMPHVRFLNALDGEHLQKWQTKSRTTAMLPLGTEGKTVTHYHLSPTDWEDLKNGEQKLCYNEIPTKVNWTYLCLDFDLETMKATGFRCNDRVFDMSGYDSIRIPAMKNLWCMLNFLFFVETDADKRAFLYIDSVCISGDF